MLPHHEPRAVGVDQVRALAPDRLGDQRLLALGVGAEEEDGRVELDELQVGDLGPGAQGERHAVAGGDGRVGGGREDLAHAAGGEDHGGGVDGADAVVPPLAHDVQGDAGGAAFGVGEEVEDEGVLDGADGAGAHGLDQGAGDLRAGRVAARVGDPAPVVAALAGERDGAGRVGLVEDGAGVDEPAYRVGPLGDEQAHGVLVAESGAGDEGVVEVLLGRVALAERGGDAALRPPRRPVVEPRLGDDDRTQPGRRAAQGGGQTGDAAADHHDVGGLGPARGGRGQPYRRAGGGRSGGLAGHEAAPCGAK